LKERELGPGIKGESDLEADSVKVWRLLRQASAPPLLLVSTSGIRERNKPRKPRLPKKKTGIRNVVLLAKGQDLQADLLWVRTMTATELLAWATPD
jgi:hypothetical protein